MSTEYTDFLDLAIPEPENDDGNWPYLFNENWEKINAWAKTALEKAGGLMTGALGLKSGTAAAPGLYLEGFNKTGIYQSDENEFAFSVNETFAGMFRKVGTDPAEFFGVDVGYTGDLRGYADNIARFAIEGYQQADASNGGLDLSVLRAGSMEHALRLSKDGYLGLSLGAGELPLGPLDVKGAVLGNVVLLGSGSTIDVRTGHAFKKTVTGNLTWAFNNFPSGRLVNFIIEMVNPGLGVHTWPAAVTWDDNGIEPEWTTAGTDTAGFYSLDGGTTIRGARVRRASA